MKKHLKKISAIALAVIMVMAMSLTAFAADATDGDLTGDGIVGDFTDDNPTVYNDVVYMYKEIKAYNPEGSEVNAPTVTYTYTIAAGSAGKDIYDATSAHTDSTSVHAQTKAGVGTPVISGSVDGGTNWTKGQLVFTPDVQFTTAADGASNKYKLKVDFSSIDFKTTGTGAGVYRYVINETTTEAVKNAAGIKEGTVVNTLYMDVYVDGNGDVYGYTCFQNNNSIDASGGTEATDDAVANAAKTEGFVSTTTGGTDGATTQTADEYFTFDLEIKKVVENDAYAVSTKHQFPFTVTLANTDVTADVLPIMTVGTGATQTTLSAAAIAGTWSPKIPNGATVKYVGIPCGTTVTVYETNDVTGVTYAAAVTNADKTVTTKNIYTNEKSNTATISCGATALAKATENHTVTGSKVLTFTNTLKVISPTGVVLRVAPYAIMLIAGLALLVIFRRRRAA